MLVSLLVLEALIIRLHVLQSSLVICNIFIISKESIYVYFLFMPNHFIKPILCKRYTFNHLVFMKKYIFNHCIDC